MNKQKRLFFAVNIPGDIKAAIGEKLLQAIPKEKWRKVKTENCHITMRFLGHLPHEAIQELEEKTIALSEFDCFEAELNGIGHFRNKVLWLGVGNGTEELNLLSRKLCYALGVRDERFHPHITLARNRGSSAKETDALIETLREKQLKRKIAVEGLELMESVLHTAGPEYKKVFSIRLRAQQ